MWTFRNGNALAFESAGHERCEHVHDADGLQNRCFLEVKAIQHLFHEICEFEKSDEEANTVSPREFAKFQTS